MNRIEASLDDASPHGICSYPSRSASRLPSSFSSSAELKRTASLLQKYPSLRLVKQMSSCRVNLVKDKDGHNGVEEDLDEISKNADIEEDSKPAAIKTERPALENFVECPKGVEELSINCEADAVWDEMDIEVTPGVVKRLIGSDETLKAFENGECIQVVCMACTVELACVMECEAIICPLCLSMSPLDNGLANECVGLGVQLD